MTSTQILSPEAPPPAPEQDCKKRTVGNKIYDFGIYGSVAWLGVAALSAVSAHEAMYGNNKAFNWLRSLNDKSISGLTNLLSSTIMKSQPLERVKGYAQGTAMFLTLGMGGHLLMGPLKYLEDNRLKNAERIDKALGTTPPDPALVAAEPKQSWKSVLSGRLGSWAASYAAFLVMGPALTKKIGDWFGEKATTAVMKIRPQADAATVRRWSDIAAFDALFTVITAAMTWGLSRALAKKHDAAREAKAVHTPKMTEQPQAQTEPQQDLVQNFSARYQKQPGFAAGVQAGRAVPAEMTM